MSEESEEHKQTSHGRSLGKFAATASCEAPAEMSGRMIKPIIVAVLPTYHPISEGAILRREAKMLGYSYIYHLHK